MNVNVRILRVYNPLANVGDRIYKLGLFVEWRLRSARMGDKIGTDHTTNARAK